MKRTKKKSKKIILVMSILLVLILAIGIGTILVVQNNLKSVSNIEINVDLSQVEDGVYEGSYSAFPVSASVKVVVQNHTITDIQILEHNHGKGEDGEEIIYSVITSQSLDVDAVSGATFSSRVILFAIENALKS